MIIGRERLSDVARTLMLKPRPEKISAVLITADIYDDPKLFDKSELFAHARAFGKLWVFFRIHFNYEDYEKAKGSLGYFPQVAEAPFNNYNFEGFQFPALVIGMLERIDMRLERDFSERVLRSMKL